MEKHVDNDALSFPIRSETSYFAASSCLITFVVYADNIYSLAIFVACFRIIVTLRRTKQCNLTKICIYMNMQTVLHISYIVLDHRRTM